MSRSNGRGSPAPVRARNRLYPTTHNTRSRHDLNVVTLLFFRYVRATPTTTVEKDALLHVPSRGQEREDEEAASSESREREIRLILDSFSRPFAPPPPTTFSNCAAEK